MPIATTTPVIRDLRRYQAAPGETIRLVEVALQSIVTPGFQRERYKAHITKIGGEFDRTGYAFPICALFQTTIIGLDGQQRIAVLEDKGEPMAAVLLIEGVKSPARLAAIYLLINRDRKYLNALEKYIGALASEDRGTLDIQRIVSDAGLEVGKTASTNGKIPAGTATRIHELGGNELLERVLEVRVLAWGTESSREANEGKTLMGIAVFLRRYWDKIDEDHLVTLLHKMHPSYILQAIDRRSGTSASIGYSDYLREQYNKARRGRGVVKL